MEFDGLKSPFKSPKLPYFSLYRVMYVCVTTKIEWAWLKKLPLVSAFERCPGRLNG